MYHLPKWNHLKKFLLMLELLKEQKLPYLSLHRLLAPEQIVWNILSTRLLLL